MPLYLMRNDITRVKADAIVNAANRTLLGGGGVDGAIHAAAGPRLLEECRTLGGCKTGEAKITGGYQLSCKYVIHTVGPIWRGGLWGEPRLLASCYRNSLLLAKAHSCNSIAFPLISAGVYGYPNEKALKIAMNTIHEFLEEEDMTVYLVLYDSQALAASRRFFADIASYIDDHYVSAHTDYFLESRRVQKEAFFEKECCSKGDACSYGAHSFSDIPMPSPQASKPKAAMPCAAPLSLRDMLEQTDAGFSETLLKLIDRTGKKDSEIYSKANVSRQHFSKIRNNPAYKPTKSTAIAFAIALELNLEETRDLIGRAGFALTNSSKFDVIIMYFIRQHNYNLMDINAALYEFDQSLLGA